MSKVTVVRCDRCKQVKEGCHAFGVHYGSRPCAAGGPSEQLYHVIDLCPDCCAWELGRVIKDWDEAESQQMLARINVRVKF